MIRPDCWRPAGPGRSTGDTVAGPGWSSPPEVWSTPNWSSAADAVAAHWAYLGLPKREKSACSSWWLCTTVAAVWSSSADPAAADEEGATKIGDALWAV